MCLPAFHVKVHQVCSRVSVCVCVEFSTVCLSQDIMSTFTPPPAENTHADEHQIAPRANKHGRRQKVMFVFLNAPQFGSLQIRMWKKWRKQISLYNIVIRLDRFVGVVLVDKGGQGYVHTDLFRLHWGCVSFISSKISNSIVGHVFCFLRYRMWSHSWVSRSLD